MALVASLGLDGGPALVSEPALAGFDLDVTVGCRFMDLAGSLVGISIEDGVEIVVRVYNKASGALIVTFAPAETDSEGYLPRMTDAALVAATEYTLMAVWPDGAVYSWNMVAT